MVKKAYAKIYGNYRNIIGGLGVESLTALTNAPTKMYFNKEISVARAKRIMLNGEKKNYLMNTGTLSKSQVKDMKEYKETLGLIASHAYSVLGAVDIVHPTLGEVCLVKIRNPWGSYEWKGDWSDKSELWTGDIRLQAGLKIKDDGIVFMDIKDFLRQYRQFTICKQVESYSYSHCIGTHALGKAALFKFTVTSKTKSTLTVA